MRVVECRPVQKGKSNTSDRPAQTTLHTRDNVKSGDDTKDNKPQPPTREAKYEPKKKKKCMSESNTELENHISRK